MRHLPAYLDRARQEALLADIRSVIAAAPLFAPTMPRTGKPFSVRMTNCGALGWVSDRDGYRYQPHHPKTRQAWPRIPEALLSLWREVTDYPVLPEACLINRYAPGARMGLHQDRDEQDFAAPVLSVSLGDVAIFRVGGTVRRAPTESLRLASGDVVILEAKSRLAYHGIDRVLAGTSDLLPEGGRLNLTLRRVTEPTSAGGTS